MTIRAALQADVPLLGAIAEAAGLFPAEFLPDMIAPAMNGGDDLWLVAEENSTPVGLAFARPEELTDRVWNLLAIGVSPDARGSGIATALLHGVEQQLDARMIVIETTQLPEQAAARAFYAKEGYENEGQVRDFYAKGEDKVIFRKVLG